MWVFFSICVLCATAIYLARRAEPFIHTHQKNVAIKIEDAPVSAPAQLEPIPVDLMNIALMESEEWARIGLIKAMNEMYERCRNWDVVRAAYSAHPVDLQ